MMTEEKVGPLVSLAVIQRLHSPVQFLDRLYKRSTFVPALVLLVRMKVPVKLHFGSIGVIATGVSQSFQTVGRIAFVVPAEGWKCHCEADDGQK